MKIATYNVNGVNGRLPVLLRWLEESKPDIVCLQELKAPHEKFDYKLLWFERLKLHAKDLLALDIPVVITGDYNVMPTEPDVYTG